MLGTSIIILPWAEKSKTKCNPRWKIIQLFELTYPDAFLLLMTVSRWIHTELTGSPWSSGSRPLAASSRLNSSASLALGLRPHELFRTQCKIEFTDASHCVSKNVTPRRMLKNCFFLIAQINRQNNSFQNMYDMLQAKVDHWSGKIYFVKKKSKNHGQLFGYADFGGCWRPNRWHQVNF